MNGSYKNELIHTRSWGDVLEVETATFKWGHGGMNPGSTKAWGAALRSRLKSGFGNKMSPGK